MKKKSILLFLPLAAMALAGCGDKNQKPQCDTATVSLDSQAISIDIGETKKLNVTTSVENCGVTWSSDDPAVATVDQNGNVTGVGGGETFVYAKVNDQNNVCCLVTVNGGQPIIHAQSIQLDSPLSSRMEMVVDDEVEINITVLPENTTDKNVTITSSNPNVVLVTDSATLLAVGDGDAKITITSDDVSTVTAEINITVLPKVLKAPEETVDGLELLHDEVLNDGDFVYFTAINGMNSYVMKAHSGSENNIKPAENTVVGDKLGVNTLGHLYSVIKNDDNTYSFADYTGGIDKPKYLAAKGGANNNYLKTDNEIKDISKFNVSISDGKASIVCIDEGTASNTIAFNTKDSIFSCYQPSKLGDKAPIQIYRADSSHDVPVTAVEFDVEAYEVPVDGSVEVGAHVYPKFATDQEIEYSLTGVEPSDSIILEGNVLKATGVGTATLVARSNSGNVENSVPVTSYNVTPIVEDGMYTISHTRDGVTYYMMNNAGKAAITTDQDDATVVDFIKVEHKINTYRIKVSDNSTEYLHADDSAALSFVEGVENASEFVIAEGTKESGAYDITIQIGDAIKHLGIPSQGKLEEFKLYANASTENTDLTPGVVKHLTGITVDTEPTKLEYFVGQALDTTGMVVTAHFDNETDRVITDYDVSDAPFEEAGEAVVVTVNYKGFNDTFTVLVKERSLLSIAIDGDMDNKNYQRTESFDPTGLRVMGTYDNEDYEEVNAALYTWSYDPEKANTVGDNQTVIVTATMNAGSIEPAIKAVTGVNVSKLHVTDVVIAGNATQIIEVGQTLSLTATVKPTGADDPLVAFSAEEGKESVLSVSQDGIVTATGVGSAKVIATSLEEGVAEPVTDTVTIQVVEALPNNTTDGFRKFLKLQDITEGASVKFFVSTTGGAVYGMGSNDAEEAKHQPGVECLVESEQIAPAAEVAEFQIVTNDDSTYSFLKDGKYLSAAGGATNGLKLVSKTLVDDVEVIPANARFNILFENGRAVIKCANDKTSAGVLSFYNPTGLPNSFSCVKAESAQSYAKVAMYIKDLPIESVNIVQDSLTLDLIEDTEGYLNYEITPSSVMPESVEWSLKNNTGAVSIDQTGKVTALQNGSDVAVVTVNGEFTDECPITVNYGPTVVTGVSLDNEELSIVEGAKATLVATVAPEEATNKNVSWTSTNETVATVDNGVITAKAPGDTIITVITADQGKTATCSVTVTAAKVATMTAENDFTGGSYAPNAYERYASDESGLAFNCVDVMSTGSGESKQIQFKKSTGILWNTSAVTNIFKLSFATGEGAKLPTVYAGNSVKPTEGTVIEPTVNAETGIVSYDFGGSYSYFALIGHKDGPAVIGDILIKYASISEYSIPVTGLTLDLTVLDLSPSSEPVQLTETISPSTAVDKTVTWSIKDGSDDCVTVVDGLVTPKATGTATIVCTSNDNSNVFAECTVTVSNVEKKIDVDKVDALVVTPDTLGLSGSYSTTETTTADGNYSYISAMKGSSSIQMKKDGGGELHNNYAFSREIKYVKISITKAAADTAKASIFFGDAKGPTENGIALGSGGSYAINTVGNIVIKPEAGSTYFSLKATNGTIYFASIEFGFVDYAAPALEDVSLDPEELEIAVGDDDVILEPIFSPSDAEPKSVSWSSDHPEYATVTNGTVHAVAAGTANITYTADGKTATCVVTVQNKTETDDVTITTKGFADITASGYQNSNQQATVEGVGTLSMYGYNGSNGQVRGSKTAIASSSTTSDTGNWHIYNTTELSGELLYVTITTTSTGSNKFQNNLYLVYGTEVLGDITALPEENYIAGTVTDTKITFDLTKVGQIKYFKICSKEKFTSGTVSGVSVTFSFAK